MENIHANCAPRGAGARGIQAPKVQIGNWYEATAYSPERGHYKPTALEGKEDIIVKIFELAQQLVGIDDTVTSITIRGIDAYTGDPYQVTIKFKR